MDRCTGCRHIMQQRMKSVLAVQKWIDRQTKICRKHCKSRYAKSDKVLKKQSRIGRCSNIQIGPRVTGESRAKLELVTFCALSGIRKSLREVSIQSAPTELRCPWLSWHRTSFRLFIYPTPQTIPSQILCTNASIQRPPAVPIHLYPNLSDYAPKRLPSTISPSVTT